MQLLCPHLIRVGAKPDPATYTKRNADKEPLGHDEFHEDASHVRLNEAPAHAEVAAHPEHPGPKQRRLLHVGSVEQPETRKEKSSVCEPDSGCAGANASIQRANSTWLACNNTM